MQEMMNQNTLYVVMAIILVIWFGLGFYLFSLDRKIKKIEQSVNDKFYEINDK
jgi:CcmD family protein